MSDDEHDDHAMETEDVEFIPRENVSGKVKSYFAIIEQLYYSWTISKW